MQWMTINEIDNKENIKIEIDVEDRISMLERNFITLNEKMDKILDILNNRN